MKAGIFTLVLLQLGVVSWLDVRHGKIKNHWSLLNLILAPALYLFAPLFYQWSWQVLILPISMLVGGFLLFLLNIMGAGDSKYLATLFLLIPQELHLAFLEKLAISTAGVALVLLAVKLVRRFSEIKAYLVSHHWEGLIKIIKSRFSYAPVMLLAWVIFGVLVWF
jgi:prepilin peptidase CpaA